MTVPATAQQPLVYEFATEAGMTSSSFTVLEGQTIRIQVYLREREAGAPRLNSNQGLLTSAVRVTYGASSAATVTGVLAAIPPWEGSEPRGSNPDSAVLNLLGPLSGEEGVKPTNDRVFLGTFTFTGHRVGEVPLTAADPNPTSNGDTLSFENEVGYDQLIDPGAATLTVVPVPEPAALAVGVAGLGALGAVRRTRFRAR